MLNIAEGGSEFSLADKLRFYRMARRSVAECAAALDLIARLHPERGAPSTAYKKLSEVFAMLTSLSKRRSE